ncbi:alanine--tRNA ligase, partial [Candidatus Woesearchaeota archaeon]|nr:alanine--tRNA ligase [Candidatus Woesearchaeota archaeon]
MHPKKLRELYFQFFQSKGHVLIDSASLIPQNDASVLFNTAGMQPLVPFLMGQSHPSGQRIVNIQKCLRTVDFENIGDNTHHTFFEMLGNWSLGDYFKEEMIDMSFEFLTKILKLPLDMLAFTCYKGEGQVPKDTEAAKKWKSLGISEDRIAYLTKDNFWSAGETGPCGPSSEMFYWTGMKPAPKKFDANDDTWVEIWNDVFMCLEKKKDGSISELKQKNIDTGMGFERAVAVLQGKQSAYETELFQPVIKKLESLSKKKYEDYVKEMRIIADHVRAAVFILGDENAVTPSNVDQGYILRRLIRRAVRYGKILGVETSFLSELARLVVKDYGDYYKELEQNKLFI